LYTQIINRNKNKDILPLLCNPFLWMIQEYLQFPLLLFPQWLTWTPHLLSNEQFIAATCEFSWKCRYILVWIYIGGGIFKIQFDKNLSLGQIGKQRKFHGVMSSDFYSRLLYVHRKIISCFTQAILKVWSILKVTNYNRHLKKLGGFNSWNIATTTTNISEIQRNNNNQDEDTSHSELLYDN